MGLLVLVNKQTTGGSGLLRKYFFNLVIQTSRFAHLWKRVVRKKRSVG
jgi:hypothetical protein